MIMSGHVYMRFILNRFYRCFYRISIGSWNGCDSVVLVCFISCDFGTVVTVWYLCVLFHVILERLGQCGTCVFYFM
jgi:hypothetical protein